jgi:HPt (histidine-containing phosphotransfer) domain-containing protein
MDPWHIAGGLQEPEFTVNMPPTPNVPVPARPAPVQLDADALARLRELDPEGRHGVVERVLKAYEASLVRMLDQLAAQADAGDAAVVVAIAHTLKSSSASIGALGLAKTCAEVEHRLRTGEPGSLGADIGRLLHDGGAALAAVRAMLRQ